MTSISACLIVKNEAKNLARCLNSIASIVDEIIVVDTGSQDDTLEIARRYTPHVHDFTWTRSFSAARNASLSYATKDWILIVDADHELPPQAQQLIPEYLNQYAPDEDRVLLFRQLTANEQALFVRGLFPNHRGIHFKGKVHEYLKAKAPLKTVECQKLEIIHHGQWTPEKALKYKALMLEDLNEITDLFQRAQHYFLLGRTEERLKNTEAAYAAYQHAYKAFHRSAANHSHRLHHNILVPLLRLSLIQHSDYHGAQVYAQSLTQYFPNFAEGWMYRAHCAFYLSNDFKDLPEINSFYVRALSHLEKSPQIIQERTRMLCELGLARIAILAQDLEQGIKTLKSLYIRSKSIEIEHHLGRAYWLAHQPEYQKYLPSENTALYLEACLLWTPLERQQHREEVYS